MTGAELVSPERVADGDGSVVEQSEIGSTREQIGVVEAEKGDTDALGVTGCLCGHRCQFVLSLVGPALEVSGLCGHEMGFEAGTPFDRCSGQAFSKGVVVAGPRDHSPGSEELDAAPSSHKAQ